MPAAGAGVRTSVVIATLAAAFNLRIALVAVGPVAPEIQADSGAGSGTVGLLSTVAILCLSVGAFWGGPLLRRLGARRVVGWCLALIAAGTAARAAMPVGWALVVATVPIGIGMAFAGVALPTIVKQHFPSRGGLLTGGYVASMTAGAALISFTIVPLGGVFGGWREALAASSLLAAGALVVWMVARVPDAEPESHAAAGGIRTRLLVLLVLVFGLQAIPFSTTITWIAAIYREAGWTASRAAATLGVITLIAIPASAILPGFSDRGGRRAWMAAMALLVGASMLGVALAPTAAPWLWLVLFGAGNGALFPLALSLPIDYGRDPAEVARLSVWMLGGGYLMSALGPVAAGALRDASGGFALPMTIVAGLAVAGAIVAGVLPAGGAAVHARAPADPPPTGD